MTHDPRHLPSDLPVPEDDGACEHIPFPLLSDPDRALGATLGLPTFIAGGEELYRRTTLIVVDGQIVHVRYPVFPPNEDAARTLDWLRTQRGHETN